VSPSEKQAEEQKRQRAEDPRLRWLHLEQTSTWAEHNRPRPRRLEAEPFERPKALTLARSPQKPSSPS